MTVLLFVLHLAFSALLVYLWLFIPPSLQSYALLIILSYIVGIGYLVKLLFDVGRTKKKFEKNPIPICTEEFYKYFVNKPSVHFRWYYKHKMYPKDVRNLLLWLMDDNEKKQKSRILILEEKYKEKKQHLKFIKLVLDLDKFYPK